MCGYFRLTDRIRVTRVFGRGLKPCLFSCRSACEYRKSARDCSLLPEMFCFVQGLCSVNNCQIQCCCYVSFALCFPQETVGGNDISGGGVFACLSQHETSSIFFACEDIHVFTLQCSAVLQKARKPLWSCSPFQKSLVWRPTSERRHSLFASKTTFLLSY